ncbi:TraY domain-containing protein [Serratia fonticola]|uniref:Relaxosome protein TraY n=1 Tax=Serratia fonticola TaxID=47917 RepID=A0AAJ2DDJ3_SERFO|nr:TraY domain-containing protein [Serratia fonticola]MDQ9128485.1 TraY domain-containing protein [Serratia fonticola]
MTFNTPGKTKTTWVNCKISAPANDHLSKSAALSSRSKKSEAELRLEDHLRRFESISSIGNVTERKK